MICGDINLISIGLINAIKNKKYVQVFVSGYLLRGMQCCYNNITGDFVVQYLMFTMKHNIYTDIFKIL